MKATELRQLCTEAISGNLFEEAYDLLWKWLKTGNKQQRLVLLKARWIAVKQEYDQGTIPIEDKRREHNIILSALLNLAGEVTDADLEEFQGNKIDTSLLVITPNNETRVEMSRFFPFEYFRDVKFPTEENYQSEIDDEDLVIFDHFEHNNVVIDEMTRMAQIDKLTWILDNSECYVVWFGAYGDLVSKYKHRIYAANFQFALYARIREMIEFIHFFRRGEVFYPENRDNDDP